MQNLPTLSDPLQQYVSETIGKTEFANLVVREIREGSFCQALKWVYPMAVSYLKRRPDSPLSKGNEEYLDSCRTSVFWQPTSFSKLQPDPAILAVDIAAQSIEHPHNIPAVNLSKRILHNVYKGDDYEADLVHLIAQEHFAEVHGWEIDPIKKRLPPMDSQIVKYMKGKVGAPYVREILDSARPGRYAKALSLIMPLADHIITRWQKDKHVLGCQGSATGTPMIKVRYFHDTEQLRPWEVLHTHNKGDANAILVALSSLDIASGFESKTLRENLIHTPVAGLRIYLALNMLACMVPQSNPNIIHGFMGYACSDFRKATASYLRCNGHLPKPTKPHAPFRYSKRQEPDSTVS